MAKVKKVRKAGQGERDKALPVRKPEFWEDAQPTREVEWWEDEDVQPVRDAEWYERDKALPVRKPEFWEHDEEKVSSKGGGGVSIGSGGIIESFFTNVIFFLVLFLFGAWSLDLAIEKAKNKIFPVYKAVVEKIVRSKYELKQWERPPDALRDWLKSSEPMPKARIRLIPDWKDDSELIKGWTSDNVSVSYMVHYPCVSPDEKKRVFIDNLGRPGYQDGIFVTDLQKKKTKIIVYCADQEASIRLGAQAWSPKGDKIVFQLHSSSGDRIGILKVGQRFSAPKPKWLNVSGRNPAWSPDGEWIAFEYKGEVYALKLKNGNIRRIAACLEGQRPIWYK